MTTIESRMRNFSAKLEEYLEAAAEPLKPYVPHIGRFLLVVTFLEDSCRILSQWKEQLWYLRNQRGIPVGLSHLFLIFNVILMVLGSGMAVFQKHTIIAVGLLFGVICSQAAGYGLLMDLGFFMRNLAVIGGLLMLVAYALNEKKRSRSVFPGIPKISEISRAKYFQLAGRLLLVLLFFSFIFGAGTNNDIDNGDKIRFSWLRIVFIIFSAAACVMVAIGFKAKQSALFLIMILSISNVILNNWWSLHHSHPQRDFMKYDFFQTLSIMGGLVLLSNIGPGDVSIDEKKKAF